MKRPSAPEVQPGAVPKAGRGLSPKQRERPFSDLRFASRETGLAGYYIASPLNILGGVDAQTLGRWQRSFRGSQAIGNTNTNTAKSMTHQIWVDTETFNEQDIKVGTARYSETVEVMLFQYAIGDGPVHVIDLTAGERIPDEALDAMTNPAFEVWASNSWFDRTMMRTGLGIEIAVERWRDTMVQLLCHGLPGSLGKACEILDIDADQAKDKRGKELIRLFCKPQAAKRKLRRATRETHPAEWEEFKRYAGSDISAMRAIAKKLPKWNYPAGPELARWHLDQRINDRGFLVDLDLARGAIAACEKAKTELAERTQDLTGYDKEAGTGVKSTTQRDALLKHILAEYGVELPDLQSGTLERRINDPVLPWQVRELLAIRLQASLASTSKYNALVKSVSSDGRLRGTLQFSGASRTGRWAGRVFQPQNLPRPPAAEIARWNHVAVEDLKDDHTARYLDTAVDTLKMGAADLLFDNVMAAASAAIRGCLVAPPGKKLAVADLANIEGRFLAWLAGEEWKLQAFRDYDAGIGFDLYKLAYAGSFGVDPKSVNKEQRQLGKVQELALGYEGGVGAFVSMALIYGVDMTEAYPAVWEAAGPEMREHGNGMWDWAQRKNRTLSLPREAYIASEIIKKAWRNANPNIVSFWKEADEAVRQAIQHPGHTFTCRRVKVRRDGAWLRCVLPSGRALCYPSPAIDDKGRITFMGVNPYTKQWGRQITYSGRLVENWTQAGAAEVMKSNMPGIDAAGYEIVLTVHDEVVTEAPDTPAFSGEHLGQLLARVPHWAPGLPLAAEGEDMRRYKK